MRKNFIILMFTLFPILPRFSYANPDVINQQRNIEFMNYARTLATLVVR